jgi:hypothetical protein
LPPPGPFGRPPHIELRITNKGDVEWSGAGMGVSGGWQVVRGSEYRQVLQITDSMKPPRYLVVDVAANAPCDVVRAVGHDLQQLAMCRAGACLERSAWENYSDGQ